MKITTLIENTTLRDDLTAEHGLSLLIEFGGRKILFDSGQSGAFADNAEKLGIDLSQVDLCVLSHGHYDHGGGLKRFLEINDHAPVYINRHAFGEYFSSGKYIGLDPALEENPRLIGVEDVLEIAEGITRMTAASDVNGSATVTVNEYMEDKTFDSPVQVYVNGALNTVKKVQGNTVTLGSAVTLKKGDIIAGIGGGKDGSAVFTTLFLGENAYGVTDIEGGGLEHIVKPRGYGNDPLNQRSSVGWKATKVAKRLLEEYIIRVESGSEFSSTANAN
jgi:hypothetical protein